MCEMCCDSASWRAHGMTDRDSPAVLVELVRADAQGLLYGQGLCSKRLIYLQYVYTCIYIILYPSFLGYVDFKLIAFLKS